MDLFSAAESGNLERVRLLVEQGADKDKGNSDGRTPLFQASCNNHLDVVEYLVEQGASLDKADNYGHTPLSGDACSGHLEVARYLIEQEERTGTRAISTALLPSTMLP
jgi:ankyrin repeat protein